MLLLHQFIPHVHHEHGLQSSVEQAGDHHHDHQEASDALFDFLIEAHAHSYHVNNFDNLGQIVKQKSEVKEFLLFSLPASIDFPVQVIKKTEPVIYYSAVSKINPFLSTHVLRGPPILG